MLFYDKNEFDIKRFSIEKNKSEITWELYYQ